MTVYHLVKKCVDGSSEMGFNGKIEEDECYPFTKNPATDVFSTFLVTELGFEKADGTIINGDNESVNDFILGDNYILKPGESIYFLGLGYVYEDINFYLTGSNKLLITNDVTFSFDWKQTTN